MTTLLAVLAAIVVGIIQASFFEWTFHRFWLHRPWLPKGVFTAHTLVHHQLCKHEDTFEVTEEEQEEALSFQWWGGPFLVAINTLPWVLIALGLQLGGIHLPVWTFVATFAVSVSIYYIGYEGLHYQMHKPTLAWVKNSAYFGFIKEHHRIHHIYMDRNLNVLFPLADLCLGTLVRTAPSMPLTPPAARTLARRHSRWGKSQANQPAEPMSHEEAREREPAPR